MSDAIRRIGLLGGECTGKTTLAEDLGRILPACVVPERLRDFVDRHGRPPRQREQFGIMLEQQAAEDAAAADCPFGVIVADPAPLMTAIYSLAYFDDASLVGPAVDLSRGYDLMLWCDIDLPWEPDGDQRDGPELRRIEHDLIHGIVNDRLMPAGIAIERVSGPAQARAEVARRAWQLRAPRMPT